jgi:NADPH:quinone reductase-like Zn-dependent oxidoreductase
LQWREIEDSKLTATQVRLEFRYGAAKHGTERMLYRGEVFVRGDYDRHLQLFRKDPSRNGFRPYVPGNLTVSEVVEVGDGVSKLSPGDHVLCRGGFRERQIIDENSLNQLDVREMPPTLAWQSAVCLDPTMFALAALRDGQVRLGDTVAIFGLGALGLTAVQLAKAMHAGMVVAVDPIQVRWFATITTAKEWMSRLK